MSKGKHRYTSREDFIKRKGGSIKQDEADNSHDAESMLELLTVESIGVMNERDQLAAHVERLRNTLSCIVEHPGREGEDAYDMVIYAMDGLQEPAQSLDTLKAQIRDEAIEECAQELNCNCIGEVDCDDVIKDLQEDIRNLKTGEK